jgi:hypothetical protein
MKMRRVAIAGLLLLAAYVVAYGACSEREWQFNPHHHAIYHFRRFRHLWEVRLFIPAARTECAIIRAAPSLFSPGKSASQLEHFLVIESGGDGRIYPYVYCEA